MAGDEPAGGPAPTAADRDLRERLGVAHDHDAATTALVAAFALVLGSYAGWLTADFGIRWVALLVVGAVAAVALYRRETRARVAATGLYALAALVALTPVALDATILLGTGVTDPWSFVLTAASLAYLVAFAVLAAVPAGIGYLVARRAG